MDAHATVDVMVDQPTLPTGPIRLLRRRDYEQLAEAGAFDPTERIELLEGVIYKMSPIGGKHARVIARLTRWLGGALDERWDVISQSSYEATDLSMPEPDIAIAPAAATRRPDDAHLVIEVAETSVGHDRYKARIYAQSGVPEYWIINLRDRVVEIHRSPRDGAYTKIVTKPAGDRVTSSSFPQLTLVLDEAVFPPDDEPTRASRRRPRRPQPRRPRSPAGRTRSR
jgi:Uma2 family endonuclease